MSNSVFRIQVEKLQSEGAGAFIGKYGEIFYDPDTGTLRLSNGTTPGGVSIAGGGGGGGSFNPTLYYTTSQVDAKFATLVGTATVQGDTLGELQQNFANYLPLSGGTLTNTLVLAGAPTNANDATTKSYVDSRVATATAGYLPTAGGTLTGPLTLPAAAPTLANQATNKAYVDSAISTAVAAIPPVSIDAPYLSAVVPVGGASIDIDPSDGSRSYNITQNGNIMLSLGTPGVTNKEVGLTIRITSNGPYFVSWPASIKWVNNSVPADPTPGVVSMYVLSTIDDGITWFGSFVGEFA